MKSIIDIYDDVSIMAGPCNTIGLGNPMVPTDSTQGSESLTQCKTAKCKKEKSKRYKESESKKIDEASLLGDIEDTIKTGDNIVEFAQWIIETTKEAYSLIGIKYHLLEDEKALSKIASCVSCPSKGVFIIDSDKMFNCDLRENWDRIFFTEKSLKTMPKELKTIKFYNFVDNRFGDMQISLLTNNISNINIEVYTDNGKSYGNLKVVVWSKIKNNNIKLGNIICNRFKLEETRGKNNNETLLFGKDSIMLSVDIADNTKLTDVFGKFENATEVKFPINFVRYMLAQHGIIPHGCNLKIYNE